MHFDAHNLTSLPFYFTSKFCLGCKTISRLAARRLIVLHPNFFVKSELTWQTFLARCQANFAVRERKGLNTVYGICFTTSLYSKVYPAIWVSAEIWRRGSMGGGAMETGGPMPPSIL